MNQKKIGLFIAECRKKEKMTQEELANVLGISNRAVSKWERGINLPDASIMIELSDILGINVNELLMGEKINIKENEKKLNDLLLKLAQQDELKNKKLMASMWTMLITNTLFYIGILLLAINTLEEGMLLGTTICVSTSLYVIFVFISLKFELDAGYYECKNCHHRFVPSFWEAMFSTHLATTRHLKCPKCHKKSYSKKVFTK